MIATFRRAWQSFRGAGEQSISVPPMDGALRPNNALEEADVLASLPGADNLLVDRGAVLLTAGPEVLTLDPAGDPRPVARLPARVTALAQRDGVLAAGLATGGLVLAGRTLTGPGLTCPLALAFAADGRLLVANGSDSNGPDDWRKDLMERNRSGSVSAIDPATGVVTRIASGLGWPCGLLVQGDGSVLVSEAWRYRLLKLVPGRAPEPVLTDLPAYPGRLSVAARGQGAWIALFAPRRRLVELVLREGEYRRRMMAEIPQEYWIAPSLRPMESFLEPLQGGTLKKLARLKPWAPSRSYGLVLRLDEGLQITGSLHSRADGTRHGITSCVALADRLLLTSAGADALLSLPVAEA